MHQLYQELREGADSVNISDGQALLDLDFSSTGFGSFSVNSSDGQALLDLDFSSTGFCSLA